MGANAVTTVPVYVSGDVLTAADLNITNSGIPVFADATARNNSFGGTGEKVLAEGQYAYLEDTNATQVYDGANWVSVGTTPGLVFITGATFSAVTSVSLPNDTFSATYTNYLLTFYYTGDAAISNVTLRFRTAGSDNTTSNYAFGADGLYSNGNSTSTNGNTSSSFALGGADVAFPCTGFLNISEPKTANKTVMNGTIAFNGNNSTAFIGSRVTAGLFNATTSFDAASLLFTAVSSGSYKVYGYSNS